MAAPIGASVRRDPRAGGADRARRLVPRRGRRAELLQGHRAPLLRLGARARRRGDGRRRRGRVRRARRGAGGLRARAGAARGRRARSSRRSCCCIASTTCTGSGPVLIVGARARGRSRCSRCAAWPRRRWRSTLVPAAGRAGGLCGHDLAVRPSRAPSRPPGPHAAPGRAALRHRAPPTCASTKALLAYVEHARSRLALGAADRVASDTAAPLILLGSDAGALGGYSGTDPALDGAGLARLVRARRSALRGARRRVRRARRQRAPRSRCCSVPAS